MTIEREIFIIETDKEIFYLDSVVEFLSNKTGDIFNFFNINKLDNKIKIILWNDITKYKKHCEKYVEYKEWMIGDTFDGNINMLSIDEARKTKEHKGITLDEFNLNTLHEFVHICHSYVQKSIPTRKDGWFWEALATNLANPFKNVTDFNVSAYDLLNKFNDISNNYVIAYTIGKYLLDNYSHEDILNYVENSEFLIADTQKLIDETLDWIKDKNIRK